MYIAVARTCTLPQPRRLITGVKDNNLTLWSNARARIYSNWKLIVFGAEKYRKKNEFKSSHIKININGAEPPLLFLTHGGILCVVRYTFMNCFSFPFFIHLYALWCCRRERNWLSLLFKKKNGKKLGWKLINIRIADTFIIWRSHTHTHSHEFYAPHREQFFFITFDNILYNLWWPIKLY